MKPAPDLSAAVAQVHAKVPRTKPVETMGEGELRQVLADVPEQLLLGPGDAEERASYFDYTLLQERAGVDLGRRVVLPDYRSREGRRCHRTLLTVPPSLRKRIEALAPGQPWSTILIALADYAASQLASQEQILVVRAPSDPVAEDRRHVRLMVRRRGLK